MYGLIFFSFSEMEKYYIEPAEMSFHDVSYVGSILDLSEIERDVAVTTSLDEPFVPCSQCNGKFLLLSGNPETFAENMYFSLVTSKIFQTLQPPETAIANYTKGHIC